MIDWNGNGKIDPVDVGISISVYDSLTDHEDDACEDANGEVPAAERNHPSILDRLKELVKKH